MTTDNPHSQGFFNQGLRLTIVFNHSEALRPFKEAVRLVVLEQCVSQRERDYIKALTVRYSNDPKSPRGPLDIAYAKANVAAMIKARFDKAWSAADIQLTSLRF